MTDIKLNDYWIWDTSLQDPHYFYGWYVIGFIDELYIIVHSTKNRRLLFEAHVIKSFEISTLTSLYRLSSDKLLV